MERIVTVTVNPCIDVSTEVEQVAPERKLRCAAPRREPGGGGLNVARAVHRLGGRALALWARGGATGALLGELLDREGVEHRPLDVAGTTRENVIVREGRSGQQYRFGFPGPSLGAAEADRWVEAVAALRPAPGLLVLSGSLPPDAPEDLYGRMAAAADRRTRVIVDTSGPALQRALESGVFLVKPNLHELARATGVESLDDDTALDAAARELVARGCCRVLVASLGAGGALLATRDRVERFHAPLVRARSKVGAGDSMVGGIALALARGADLTAAVRYGVATGAAAVITPGTGLCRREDAEHLHEEMLRRAGRREAA